MAEASLYVKGFIILRSEGGLTSFNINNRVNFSGEQKQNETLSFFVVVFWFFFFFENMGEILKNLPRSCLCSP